MFYLDLTGTSGMYGGMSGLAQALLSAGEEWLRPRLGILTGVCKGPKSGVGLAWEGAVASGILVVTLPKAGDPQCAFPENAIRCKRPLKRICLTSPSHN